MKNRIVIFHSNPETMDALRSVLSKQGFSISLASNLEECMAKLKNEKPDLLLVESLIPRERILEEAKKAKRTKILYLLSDDSDKGELMLYENVVGFVDEPFELEKFVGKVKGVLKI